MNLVVKILRIPPVKKSDRGDEVDVQPVYLGEFPQEVRDAQIMSSQNRGLGWSRKLSP